jgi:hypothetical protein
VLDEIESLFEDFDQPDVLCCVFEQIHCSLGCRNMGVRSLALVVSKTVNFFLRLCSSLT